MVKRGAVLCVGADKVRTKKLPPVQKTLDMSEASAGVPAEDVQWRFPTCAVVGNSGKLLFGETIQEYSGWDEKQASLKAQKDKLLSK